MKNIAVVIDRAPCDGVAEVLRMTAGLTLNDENRPAVLFVGAGLESATPEDDGAYGSAVRSHLEMLGMMKVPLIIDSVAVAKSVAGADIIVGG